MLLFGILVAGLGGLVGFAVSREAAAAPKVAQIQAADSRPAVAPPRPALARDEQIYVESLWPIHSEVERAAVRVALGASFYHMADLSRDELKSGLDTALAAYRTADGRLRELRPPESLQAKHNEYVDAVNLFQASTVEMLRMYDDGSDEHLVKGFPLSVAGADRIHEVGTSGTPT